MMSKYGKTHIPRPDLHDKILEVTMAMFQEQGIKQVKMDDIARKLSISKRTLYEIFEDKETLLLKCINRQQQMQEDYMRSLDLSQSNVLDVVLRYYQYTIERIPPINPVFFEDMEKYPAVLAVLRKKRAQNFKSVVAYFNKGIEQGIFQPVVDMELFMRLLNLTFDKCMESGVYKAYSVERVFRAVLFTYLRGIATEKGLEILDAFIRNMENKTD